MNVNNIIMNALSPEGLPIEPAKYKGSETVYYVFNYADDRAEDFADDEPQIDVASMQIHLFAPKSFDHTALKKRTRARLYKAGFTYPTITTIYEDETEVFHIIFECEIEGKSETEVN